MTGPIGFLIGVFVGIKREKNQALLVNDSLGFVAKNWSWILRLNAILAIAGIVIAIIYIPRYQSKYSPSIESKSDFQMRDKSITQINVRSLPDNDIKLLSKFNELKLINFTSGWGATEEKITDSGLSILSELQLPKLEHLSLGYCSNISDKGLKYIAEIKTLKMLLLMSCEKITDEGIKNLTLLKNLEYLDLRGCNGITDESIKYFSEMISLKNLVLDGCKNISKNAVEKLQEILPDCNIKKNDKEWSYRIRNYRKKY